MRGVDLGRRSEIGVQLHHRAVPHSLVCTIRLRAVSLTFPFPYLFPHFRICPPTTFPHSSLFSMSIATHELFITIRLFSVSLQYHQMLHGDSHFCQSTPRIGPPLQTSAY